MNPSPNVPQGNVNLPPPMSMETLPQQPNMPAPNAPEMMPARPEIIGQQAPTATAQAAAMPLPVPTAPLPIAPTQVVPQTTQSAVPQTADDNDLIEKEWVTKAKQIIEKTINDPHQQSKELSVFRADYMQKRYNKQIKLSE